MKGAFIVGNDINPFFRYAVRKIKNPEKVCLIDDGSGSVNYNPNYNPINHYKHIRNKLLYSFLSIKSFKIRTSYFFSTYDSIKKVFDGEFIKNDFEFLKNKKVQQQPKNCIYFVGDPHVERGYLDEKIYLKILY